MRRAVMDTVMRYQVGNDSSVLVEIDEDTYGVEAVSRLSDGVFEAGQRLESALGTVSDAARATLDAMKKLGPETVEVEFGIKLAGEAGAMIAKTSAEGHFTVRLVWSPTGDDDGHRPDGPQRE
jgi:Trypsin-co-occurring domain 1